MAPTRRME